MSWAQWLWLGLAGLTLGVLLTLVWLKGVAWFYRIPSDRPQRRAIRCADGWEVALYHRPARPRRYLEPVVLAHGLAANHHFFDLEPPYALAPYLADLGFECFSVEWRGTGASNRAPRGRRWWQYTVDDHIRFDGPAALKAALEATGASQAFWVGHSLGGLVGYGVAQGDEGGRLKGMAAVGSPVFFQYAGWFRHGIHWASQAAWPFALRQKLAAWAAAPLAGWVVLPFTDIVANPQHISPSLQRKLLVHALASIGRPMLMQLADWTQHDVFRSMDQAVDYRAGIGRMTQPLLVLAGSQDRLATPENARAQLELCGSADKTLVVLGKERGDLAHYGHGDLLFGSGAPQEAYPLIGQWLTARATRWSEDPP